jgi:hypothetical protein
MKEGFIMTNTVSGLQTVPARKGKAVHVKKDQAITIINTHGTQVVSNSDPRRGYLTRAA